MPKLKIEKEIINGNIPINKKLLNKYSNVEQIFEHEKNYQINTKIKNNIKELKSIDLKNMKVFKKYITQEIKEI